MFLRMYVDLYQIATTDLTEKVDVLIFTQHDGAAVSFRYENGMQQLIGNEQAARVFGSVYS